jgi:hypothetical protein
VNEWRKVIFSTLHSTTKKVKLDNGDAGIFRIVPGIDYIIE